MKGGYFVLVAIALMIAPFLDQPSAPTEIAASHPLRFGWVSCTIPDQGRAAWQLLTGAS